MNLSRFEPEPLEKRNLWFEPSRHFEPVEGSVSMTWKDSSEDGRMNSKKGREVSIVRVHCSGEKEASGRNGRIARNSIFKNMGDIFLGRVLLEIFSKLKNR